MDDKRLIEILELTMDGYERAFGEDLERFVERYNNLTQEEKVFLNKKYGWNLGGK